MHYDGKQADSWEARRQFRCISCHQQSSQKKVPYGGYLGIQLGVAAKHPLRPQYT